MTFGQAIFLPTNSNRNIPRIICTGYSELGDKRKLGIVYCTNRSTGIYELSFNQSASPSTSNNKTGSVDDDESEENKSNAPKGETNWQCHTAILRSPEGRSARSPRVLLSSFEPLLIFISNPTGGPHNSCATLHAASIRKGNTVVLVDTVLTPTPTKEDFPGLYVDQLPNSCFILLPSGPHVVLTSIWRSRKVPLLISLKTGKIINLLPWSEKSENDVVLPYLGDEKKGGLESLSVLGTDGRDRIVGLRSSSIRPSELVIGSVKGDNGEIDWVVVKKPKLSHNGT